MKKIFLLVFICNLQFITCNFAEGRGPGTTSGIFLRQTLGARAFGLGNTYTGISNDIEALWFNTAGTCEIDYPVIAALFSNDISGTNHGFLAFAKPFEKFTAAFSVSALQTDKIEINMRPFGSDDIIKPYSVRAESDYIAMFALGVPIGGFLNVGGGIKFLHSELAEEYVAKTVAFDGGLLLRGLKHPKIGEISVGVSYQNLGKKLKYDEKYNDLPQTLRCGAAVKRTKKEVGEIIVGYDISKIAYSDIHHNFGIELTAFDKWLAKPLTSFSIRTGYGLGYSIEGPSFGLGFGLKKIRCDYGMQLTDFESRHKFLVTYSFEPDTAEKDESESAKKPHATEDIKAQQSIEKTPTEKMAIAILNFSAEKVSEFESVGTSNLMRKSIKNTETFHVIEREKIEEIMEKRGFRHGCSDIDCAKHIGTILNADKAIVGTVSRTDMAYIVNIRIIDVKTGKIEYEDKCETWSMEGMEMAIDKIAEKFIFWLKP